MRIRENGSSSDIEVYGIYWVDNKRHHFCIPYENFEGLMVIREDECEVTDPEISRTFVLFKGTAGGEVLIVKEAADDNLIYDLIDYDPDAMAEFRKRIGV